MEMNMKYMNGALAQPRLSAAWLKRLGAGGFLFFLIKGLLWILLPAVLGVIGLK
jgi:hypothetical protein